VGIRITGLAREFPFSRKYFEVGLAMEFAQSDIGLPATLASLRIRSS
jgi:hypothetical protein